MPAGVPFGTQKSPIVRQQNASMQRGTPAELVVANPLRAKAYNKIHEANFGRGPAPHPYVGPTNSATRFCFTEGQTGEYALDIGSGEHAFIYANPYGYIKPLCFLKTTNAASTTGGLGASIYNQNEYLNSYALVTGQTPALPAWRSSPFLPLTIGAAVDTTNLDVSDNPSSVVGYRVQGNHLIPFHQLLGGKFTAKVVVPFDGACTVQHITKNDLEVLTGGYVCTELNRPATSYPTDQGLKFYANLPMVPINLNLVDMIQTYGHTTAVKGGANGKLELAIPLPQDNTFWSALGATVAETTTSATSDYSVSATPKNNPIFFSQYGVIHIYNGGSVAITCTVQMDARYATTFPDVGSEGATENLLMRNEYSKASYLSHHSHDTSPSLARAVVTSDGLGSAIAKFVASHLGNALIGGAAGDGSRSTAVGHASHLTDHLSQMANAALGAVGLHQTGILTKARALIGDLVEGVGSKIPGMLSELGGFALKAIPFL